MKRLAKIFGLYILTTTAFAQQATTFYVNDDRGRDIVTVTSKAPLETIVSTTSAIKGYISADLNDVKSAIDGRFYVELSDLDTGIGLRNTHMREQYLETDKYPKAVFVLTKVVEVDGSVLEDNKPVKITAEGNFTVHGVTRTIQVPLTVTYLKESESTKSKLPGDLLHIQGGFDILLSDYNIRRPQFVILKLDEKQKIELDAFGSTAVPPADLVE